MEPPGAGSVKRWYRGRRRPSPPDQQPVVDSFAGAWPVREAAGGVDAPFAKVLGDARKIVVSSRPLEFTWRNSEQLQGDFVEARHRAAERTW
ncbi:MAG TPA: hypothetical protein VGQ92_09955 [Actinoplanes sp.]|nr:hypothetical protein [Actinoplanes sp.]